MSTYTIPDAIQDGFALFHQMRQVHLVTDSYAVHKATDDMSMELLNMVDKLGETYLGTYPSRRGDIMVGGTFPDADILQDNVASYLNDVQALSDSIADGFLKNVLDELADVLARTLYLLTLH